MSSHTARALTLSGEDPQAHAGVTELDKGTGPLSQPRAGQEDVPATHVSMGQVLVLLRGELGGIRSRSEASIDGYRLYLTPTHGDSPAITMTRKQRLGPQQGLSYSSQSHWLQDMQA